MSESETDKRAKKRLEETADALETLLSLNDSYKELISEVDELVGCDILTNDIGLVKQMSRFRKAAIKK